MPAFAGMTKTKMVSLCNAPMQMQAKALVSTMDNQAYPILTHIADLRKSLIRAIAGICCGFLACLAITDQILSFLRKPLEAAIAGRGSIVVLTPQEYFFTELKAAAIAGIFVASPYVFY